MIEPDDIRNAAIFLMVMAGLLGAGIVGLVWWLSS